MRKGKYIVVLVIGCIFLTGAAGLASKPVNRKSVGCVINGKVYSIYNSDTVYRYRLPNSFNLKPYEGKKVELEGMLSPGDHFAPKRKTLKVLGPCDRQSQKLIRKTEGK